jgi:Cu2+-exporting ATPase
VADRAAPDAPARRGSAQLNVATEKLYVRWRTDDRPGDILARCTPSAMPPIPTTPRATPTSSAGAAKTLGRQLFVAGLSMMQVMMYVAPAYLAEDGTLDDSMAR